MLVSTWFIGGLVPSAHAVPAWPGVTEVAQPDGTRFGLRLKGDEFFSWHETEDGYVIARDVRDGTWKYARPSTDKAAFELLPEAAVGKVDPKALGLRAGELPPAVAIRRHMESGGRYHRGGLEDNLATGALSQTTASTTAEEETGPEQPPQPIPVSGTKTISNVVILACFNDHWNTSTGTVSASYGRTAASEYDNLFNEVGHTSDGAVGSVRDYYTQVSYGKLTVDSIVTAWVRLPNNESYYGANVSGNDKNPQQMVIDAINAADAAGFDFSQGDSDADGWVDCFTIIHSGHGEEYTGNPANCIWSHQWSLNSPSTKDGVSMMTYHTEPALRGLTSSTSIIRIGVICHETGHFFGLPDLYDYSDTTEGIGEWGLMASGSWNGSDGKSPAHFSAWSKYMLGFVQPVQMHSKAGISLPRVEDNPVVHFYRDGMSNGEYFLVENRARFGFDNTTEIYPGILIYHIDSKSGNNDLGTWPHPVVKIEEADGNNSLSANRDCQAGDAWSNTSGLAGGFRDQTGNQNTNAMRYQTADYSRPDNSAYYSYNRLNTFSATSATMTYTASTLKPIVDTQTVATSGYTVNWGACTNATQYEIQEGSPVTLTSFSDGAETEDGMFDKWYLSGTVQRRSDGARTGSYSYVMQLYDTSTSRWYSSVQSLTQRKPFKITTTTNVSFYMVSKLEAGSGYLKCEISKDNGNTWITLGTYAGLVSSWTQRSFNYAALNAAGINANDSCILRFVTNFEELAGWTGFASAGYGIDDISINNVEIASYGNWVTLNNAVPSNSYTVSSKTCGQYAYQVRAYANSAWQGYGDIGVTTVDLPSYTVNFQTDGTPGATLSGTTAQTVCSGSACTSVTANSPVSHIFSQWTSGASPYSSNNTLTVTNVTSNMTLTANYLIKTFTLTYNAGTGGTIVGATPQTVNYGDNGTTVMATPNAGYHFVNWSDGLPTPARQDTSVSSDITVTANFAADTYTVAFDATGGNTPVPESKAVTYNAPYGPLATTARTGYGFNGWFTAPDSGSLITEATIVSIASSHTLYAQWTANTYTVQYVADPSSGGSVSGNTTIAHAGATGDSVVVQVTPNTGWSVGDVDATNGVIAFTSGNEYLLSGVTDNTTVTAHFVEDTVEIHTWVYLEGAAMDQGGAVVYNVPMHATLNDLRILPGQTFEDPFLGIVYSPPGQPYSAAPWFYTGTEGVAFDSGGNLLNGDAGYPPTVVDWVLVSLRATADGGPVWQAAALLHNDGAVEFVDGSLPCCGADPAGPFYLVIEHYNHLIVMSHEPVPVVDHTLTYDFRSQQSYIDDPFGFGWVGQKEILPGVYALYGGNGDQASGEYTDTDITADDQAFWMQQNGIYGLYKFGDYIMNGDVNSDDVILWGLNNSKTTSVPRN